MKKTTLVATLAILAVILSVTLVFAQGRGAGYCRVGQPCPYGNVQPNPNAGGWWTKVQPTTPEQQALVAKVTDLHNQIRNRQLELAQLRNANGDPNQIRALEQEVVSLQNDLHQCMLDSQQTRQKLGPGGRMGGAGMGRLGEPCPYGNTQPNPNAGGWWTGVQPTTPEQQAFVARVTDLHSQIRNKQFELAQLQNTNGDPKRIQALEQEAQRLRTELYDYMAANQQVRRQMGVSGNPSAGGRGCYGMQGQCPNPQGPGYGMRGQGFGARGMGRGARGGAMNAAPPFSR